MNILAARLAIAATCALTSPLAIAGGWIGGGGELLEDSMNPWFVQSGHQAAAAPVRYCLEVDEPNFGVTRDNLYRLVQSAFNYWRDEFAEAMTPYNGPGMTNAVLVATESFVPMETCDDQVKIRFQFGVLSPEQLQEFRNKDLDPRRFVALAARTDYDPKTLQGKGFVYVAPMRGPLGMSTPDLQPDAWQENGGARLYSVIRHELGHVFGIQHTGTHRELMGGGHPEYAVAKSDYFWQPGGVFKIPSGATLQKICYRRDDGRTIPQFLVDFFGIPAGDECLGLKVYKDRLEVVSAKDNRDRVKAIGAAKFEPEEVRRFTPLVRLWLTNEQSVFRDVPTHLGHVLEGPTAIRRQVSGTFKNTGAGIERELIVNLAPEAIQISGIWNGKMVLDVFSHREQPTP